jgi:beta-lactam-binding protein with PASTA domain
MRWTLSVAAALVVVIAALVAWRIASSSRSSVADAGAKPVTTAPAPVATTPPVPVVTTPTAPVAPVDSLREVPSLVGRSLVEARSQVERIGLVVGTISETRQGGIAGAITAQRPAAGERVGPGTAIDLVVTAASLPKLEKVERSTTPKVEARVPQQVEVPSLTGLSVDVARDRLVRRGLSVGSVSVRRASRSEVDVVLAQDPAAGARRPRDTPVSLVIGGEQ